MNNIVCLLLLVLLRVEAERIKIHTTSPAKGRDYQYFPLRTNHLEFNIKAKRDASILLSNQFGYNGPYYEIVIGGNGNTISVISKNQTASHANVHSGVMFQFDIFQRFWVHINDTDESISVGKSSMKPFLYFQDPDFIKMSKFAISSGWGSDAHWDFDDEILNFNKCN